MGATPSKQPNSRRSSKRQGKSETLQLIEVSVRDIRTRIETQQDATTYDTFLSLLSRNSTRVQEIKNATKKQQDIEKSESILHEINVCIGLLEDKQNPPEDKMLDLGAVESTSFISQDVKKFIETPHERQLTLSQIERNVNAIDLQLRKSVELKDFKTLTVLEKKINILYKDLEQVHPVPYSPLHERKENLASKLIKFNKKIDVVRRKSQLNDSNDGMAMSKPLVQDPLLIVMRIEQDLNDLEVNAFTFEDTKSDNSFVELNKRLRNNFSVLDGTTLSSDEGKRRVLNAKSLIKKIMQELNKKAVENETVIKKELGEVTNIEKEITKLKTQVEVCSDSMLLDQQLRVNWAKLNDVKGTHEKTKVAKEKVIREIQNILKQINDKRVSTGTEVVREVENLMKSCRRLEQIVGGRGLQETNKETYQKLQNITGSLGNLLRGTDEPDVVNNHKSYSQSSQMMQQLVSELAETEKVATLTKKGAQHGKPVENLKKDVEISKTVGYLVQRDVESNNMCPETSKTPDYLVPKGIADDKKDVENFVTSKPVGNVLQKGADRKNEYPTTSKKDLVQKIMEEQNQKPTDSLAVSLKKIQKLESEIMEIRTQIKTFPGTTDSELYDVIENQLINYKTELENIIRNDGTIAKAKLRAFKKLQEATNSLRDRAEINDQQKEVVVRTSINRASVNRKSSTNTLLLKIMTVDSDVHNLEKQIINYKGRSSDKEYTDIQKNLTELESSLQSLNLQNHDNLIISQRDVLQHINKLQLDFTTKATENDRNISEIDELKKVLQRVQQVQTQVDNFYGTYKSIQFLQLENELLNSLDKLEGIKGDTKKIIRAKTQGKENVVRLLKILEERSIKLETLSPYQRVERVRDQILLVKSEMEKFIGSYEDEEYYRIVSQTHKCNDDIEVIPDEGHQSIKDTKTQYLQYIRDLLDYFETRTNPQVDYISRSLENLDMIDHKADDIMQQIKDNKDVGVIDGNLIALISDLDRIDTLENGDIKERRRVIMQKLNKCAEQLDQQVKVVNPKVQKVLDDIEMIMGRLVVLNEQIRMFKGRKNDQQHAGLDEALIHLFLQLDHLDGDGDGDVKSAKQRATKEIQRNMKLLDEMVAHSGSVNDFSALEGTEV